MSYLSTYQIFYPGGSVTRVFSTDREAVKWFEVNHPDERWTYLKDLVTGETLGHDDYDRLIKHEQDDAPRLASMASSLKWAAPPPAPEKRSNRAEVTPVQGSLF